MCEIELIGLCDTSEIASRNEFFLRVDMTVRVTAHKVTNQLATLVILVSQSVQLYVYNTNSYTHCIEPMYRINHSE